jgi:RNA polymerase sigma-70 factor (ECF subfamily)
MNFDSGLRRSHAQFTGTHWSLVLAARQWPSPEAQGALAKLCQAYWYPLYAFVRRRGHAPDEAQDFTQEFFRLLLANGALQSVDRAKGRFRTFLLAALTNFLANETDRRRARKRGGDSEVISLDSATAEERYALEPAQAASPEAVFDRRWAFAVVERVLGRLQAEYTTAGKGAVFSALQGQLTGEAPTGATAEAAATLNLSEGAVRVALHRLRRRFGELLRHEIAQTVARPEDVDEEIRHLFAVISA